MTGYKHSNRFACWGALVLAILAGNVVQAAELTVAIPQAIEVFTSSELPITGKVAINPDSVRPKTDLHIYELDGIQRIEARLSKGLTADPEQAKRVVLQRIQKLNDTTRTQMQRTAIGLAKAVQYGIDRYPAIVFDGEVVIYGMTDIRVALRQYQQWRERGKR